MPTNSDMRYSPESVMMSHGYRPEWSELSAKCPLFPTSTFVFKSAEEGKRLFEVITGARKPDEDEIAGLIYSRFNNPDIEILEDRLAYWERADACAAFASGMAAISSTLLEFLKPGDIVLHSDPLYGGTDGFFNKLLFKFGVRSYGISAEFAESGTRIRQKIREYYKGDQEGRLKMIFIETPANPTNEHFDIEKFSRIARDFNNHVESDDRILVVVDNTFLGPVFQMPLIHGADLVIYSATKYLGGHSDLVAGACLGSKELIARVKSMRSGSLGNMIEPWTAWLLMRSLETLKIRMETQVAGAIFTADFLNGHSKIKKVYYPTRQAGNSEQAKIYEKQCEAPGAMISFDIVGGEKEAFRFLNALELIKLAVSLGGTESLAEHPASMTHAGVPKERRDAMGITDSMIRLSVGLENPNDLVLDLSRALNKV